MFDSSEWRETENGSYVLLDDSLAATVFYKDGSWSGIWNGASDGQARLLKAKCETAENAMEMVDEAIAEGDQSRLWWPPAGTWRRTKDGKGWYRQLAGGAMISVKQARTGSWYVTHMGEAMLGRGGRPTWFQTADQAKEAYVELSSIPGSGWEWAASR